MPVKFFASAMIAALLMTGTVQPVSPTSGQGAQLPESTVAAAIPLTETEAMAIALAHAELTESDVTDLVIRLDRDDHRRHWEIRWKTADWVYDYDIDPDTGAILEWEREPSRRTKTDTHSPAADSGSLTREEAQAIALDHAGFTADQVTGLRISRDRDDATPTYEVEFRVGRWEYEYEIHAETGRILDFDKDD